MSSKSETPGPKQWGTGRPSETGVTVPRQEDHASSESSSSPAEACESHESHGPGGPPIRQTARFGGAAPVPPDRRTADTSNESRGAASAELTRAELDKLRRIEAWAWKHHAREVQALLGSCEDSVSHGNWRLLLDAMAWQLRMRGESEALAGRALRALILAEGWGFDDAADELINRYRDSQAGR